MKKFRYNKRKQKNGCGCKLCKPHKGKWCHFFKKKYRELAKDANKEIDNY